MNTLEISSNKIYSRLLVKINDQSIFPKYFFDKKSLLYTVEKKDPSREFGIVNIKDSIHYKYAINKTPNLKIYENYVKIAEQYDHSSLKYDTLIADFNLDELAKNKVVLKKIKFRKQTYYEIIDGCHRLSVYFLKFKKLPPKFYVLSNYN
jgi:hypothetical protein